MAGENLCHKVTDSYKYPGIEENDDEDDLPHSLDNHSGATSSYIQFISNFLNKNWFIDNVTDLEFGLRRQRSNTAIRLEKMDKEKREAASITHVKWTNPRPFASIPGTKPDFENVD